jgi:hypothetical protein
MERCCFLAANYIPGILYFIIIVKFENLFLRKCPYLYLNQADILCTENGRAKYGACICGSEAEEERENTDTRSGRGWGMKKGTR